MSIDRRAIDPLLPIVAFEGHYEAIISLNMPGINLNFLNDILSE